ncbi:GntR family transcriptional regulator [uncultured Ruminococcus sp.]|uniref:GntR family transcriptional regulator n=1 Tax=uncultured Ruminococcus sp. TaxID=165186 RepID=UPI0025D1D27D|nr:GntR family transcriptional regulator [uncultured Ruminococcus sp.]
MDNYKYLMIVEWVKDNIAEKGLKPGDRFLTEKQLCEIHNVSRQTVRQALMLLESENVIVRMRGSGTYVGSRSRTSPSLAVKGNVGVISTYFSDYIFPHIVTGIESVLGSAGCTMQLAITHDQVYEETQALESMLANGVKGLIVEPSKSALPNPNKELYARLERENIPLVFFNAKYTWSKCPCVAMDDEAAGRIVTDYLFDCGHRDIAGIFALDDIQGHKRYSGFMESCLAHGVTAAERNVMWFSNAGNEDMFSFMADKLVKLAYGRTAVVCYNDKLAVKLLKIFRENCIKVPEDISVVGIDDSHYASICEVPLTTVHHPQKKLGEAAAQLLLEMMGKHSGTREDMLFVPELVVRDSVLDMKLPKKG